MALLPENKRDQAMLGICLGAIALAVVYYMYMWSPKSEELGLLQTRLDSLEAQNEIAKREVASGNASKLKAEADEYGRMLTLMRQLVPTANEVPALLDQISTAARRTGLDIGAVTPLGVVPGDVFDTYKFKMGVKGPYHDVTHFLSNVGSLTRIVAPMNLALVPTTRTGVANTPGKQVLDVTFEIQTYVAKTAPPSTKGQ